MKEFRAAIRIVWGILSISLLLVLLAPVLVPSETLLSNIPTCRRKALYNKECVLCGMSTAFVLISEGRVNEAREKNAGAVPLYFLMLSNGIIFAASLTRHLHTSRNTKLSHPSHSPLSKELSSCKPSASFGESLRS